ncbi:hypothetical protein ORJ00_18830 [Rheinheimera baltica]|uniref:DUF6817 domain-containing protein n=1 Tax=Rheinheimera baltica TaxID=67576 RepID=UPI00273E5FE0|nr:hypothetical protein [Rheinheimera baltica]MDP5144803.1 hypothetical protein [Rheinheimera baltica]
MINLQPTVSTQQRIAFLREHEAQDISHSGRDLLTHLQGTHDILQRWQLPESLCLAGLFHSVYGTDGFTKQPVALHKRKQVQQLIGDEAEHLVYLFCCIRRITLFDGKGAAGVRFRAGYQTYEISQDEFSALLHLEYANTLEQCGELGFLGRFVKNKVGSRWLELKHLLSQACNTELAQVFKNAGKVQLQFLIFEPVFWLIRKLKA